MAPPLIKEEPALLTARAGLARAGVVRAGFAPRDTKDGTVPGTVAGDYIAELEAEPAVTRTVEVAP